MIEKQGYKVFGLTFCSDFVLDSDPFPPGNDYDVLIERGKIPKIKFKLLKEGVCFLAGEKDFLLDIPDIAKYWISEGNRIVVEPHPQTTEDSIVLFLTGSAMGALLIQRGTLALHASAVEKNGKAILFSGISGAGKSTINKLLQNKAYRFVADDISVISKEENSVFPGFHRMKIWKDVLVFLKNPIHEEKRIRPEIMKYHVSAKTLTPDRAIPVKVIYILRTHNKETFVCDTLEGIDKFNALKNNTYRSPYIAGKEAQKNHFEQCTRLAKSIIVKRITRPRNNKDLEKLADFVVNDLKKIKPLQYKTR